MRKILPLILLVLLFSGCESWKERNQVIDKETFANILTDIHMADATLAIAGLQVKSDSAAITNYYNDVLVKYQVTQKKIEDSFKYYATKPRQFEKIYEQVSENLAKMESEYDEQQKEANKKKAEEKSAIKAEEKIKEKVQQEPKEKRVKSLK